MNTELKKKTLEQNFVFQYPIKKRLLLTDEDILNFNGQIDLLVCSAFRGSYRPDPHTLIGQLDKQKGISFEQLSKDREDAFGDEHLWLSPELANCGFRRIACIELLDPKEKGYQASDADLLQNAFFRLRQLLTDMARNGFACRKVAMTVPGIGNQGLEPYFVMPPLLVQCKKALRDIQKLEEISICETNEQKYQVLSELFLQGLSDNRKPGKVFVSYSSKDAEAAYNIRDRLSAEGIACWMAPESIPASANYQSEIPKGLNETGIFLLVQTENAEKSRWVYKEVGTAIGTGHVVLPCKLQSYSSSEQFNFILDGEQIFPAYSYENQEEMYAKLVRIVKRIIQTNE